MTQNKRQKSNHPSVFDDVVIRLSRKSDGGKGDLFQAEIRQTPIPLEGGDFQIKMSEQLEEFHTLFAGQVAFNHAFFHFNPQVEQMANDLAGLRDKLYQLLPISIRDDLPRLIQQVNEQGRGIHLIIEASARDQADRLLSLPWELLFIRETQVYPARSSRVLIVRRLLDAARHSPIKMAAPFNLVHLIADDPEQPIDTNLQQMERQTIPASIGSDDYTLVEKPGSVQKLLDVMRQTKHSQILHFLGHGGVSEQKENSFAAGGYLCFVNEVRERQWITGERLQHLLSGTPGLQLIVLNACDSASVVTSHVALDLVHSGFPYVVAMQAEMAQEAAKHFIRAFYSQLQQGQSIEYAVAAGRMEIASQLPGAIDWCLPVLYTNVGVADKPLLDKAADKLGEFFFGKPVASRRFGVYHIIVGGLHLWVGLLSLLSGTSQPLPDVRLIAWTTGWLVVVPPLLVMWMLYSRPFEIPNGSSRSTRIAFIIRLLWAAAIGLGGLMLQLFLVLILLAGLGFWALLSPPVQVLLLLPFLLTAILISYWVVRSHAQGFITTTQVEPETFDWRDLITLLAGVMMLLGPIGFLYYPDILGPFTLRLPVGNLVVGILCFFVGLAIYQEETDKSTSQGKNPLKGFIERISK